jgi:predicted DNA-binding transcriptional regulator AlpA
LRNADPYHAGNRGMPLLRQATEKVDIEKHHQTALQKEKGGIMLTGWKAISNYTGFSRNTLKRLFKEEKFPVDYIATKPVTTEKQIEDWLQKRKSAQ